MIDIAFGYGYENNSVVRVRAISEGNNVGYISPDPDCHRPPEQVTALDVFENPHRFDQSRSLRGNRGCNAPFSRTVSRPIGRKGRCESRQQLTP